MGQHRLRGGRLTRELYDALFEAYCLDPSARFVSEATGVTLPTVRKYIEKGDPRRGLPALSLRYSDARRVANRFSHDKDTALLEKRMKELSTVANATYMAMVDPDTHTLVNPANATPQSYILLIKEERALADSLTLKERMEDVAEQAAKVEFTDPAMKEALKRRLVEIQKAAVLQTARRLIAALDPTGDRKLAEELPPEFKRLIEAEVEVVLEDAAVQTPPDKMT